MGTGLVSLPAVIRLDAATVLLQWAAGGLACTWITTRHRVASLGYGWLSRAIFGTVALGAFIVGVRYRPLAVRDVAALATVVAALAVTGVSVGRRRAGVSGQRAEHDRRSARVAAMTGIQRVGRPHDPSVPEFPPLLDLIAPAIAVIGLVAGALDAASTPGDRALAVARALVGAAFLGAVSASMLVGHWYLSQPGLPRWVLREMVDVLLWVWPLEVAVMLVPTGMISVFTGSLDDGWGGTLGWMWLACALSTPVFVFLTRAVLKERSYVAVLSATGFTYLALVTGFGTDLVARAVLAP